MADLHICVGTINAEWYVTCFGATYAAKQATSMLNYVTPNPNPNPTALI